jgi:very-short-patch-repair endonuclease
LVGKIFLGRAAVDSGLLTPADLRSSAWKSVLRGVYADAALAVTHAHRCIAVTRYLLPPSGVIAGRSAASFYRAFPAGADEPVEVLVLPSDRVAASTAIRVHVAELGASDVRLHGGLRLTSPARTAWDLAQWLDPIEAVVRVDALLAARLLSITELREYVRSRAGARGWRRADRVASLVDAGAESAMESRLRVRLVLGGLPAPVTQYVVEHEGRFVARVDLAYPDQRVAIEYDGRWHDAPGRFEVDRDRLNNLASAGWIVLHVTAKRMREDLDGLIAEIELVLRAR